ncbi:MAG: Uma2 family endonuclease [Verrucomicrobiales bacterium]|jgi:Uma2 family endonuclease
MTAQLAPAPFISLEEYFAGEDLTDERHEYSNGQVVKMGGASDEHELVVGEIFAAIHAHLKGKPCNVTPSNLKLKLELNHADLVYYPDAMVWCDPADNERLFKTSPRVIVEVMSDYKKDHVEKLFAYQQVASLEDYLIIDQNFDEPQAWIYRRATNWDQERIEPGGVITLPSIEFSIPLDELYADRPARA